MSATTTLVGVKVGSWSRADDGAVRVTLVVPCLSMQRDYHLWHKWEDKRDPVDGSSPVCWRSNGQILDAEMTEQLHHVIESTCEPLASLLSAVTRYPKVDSAR